MTTYLWTINQLNRLTSDGFVITAHYNVSATDGTYQASTYGTASYTQTPGESYVPYAALTEAVVVGWVKASLGEANVEASLQSQIDALKAPVQEAGGPWSAE